MNKFTPRISTVKGISNVRRLPRLNKIRLGITVENKKGTTNPFETDYFVCPPEVQAVFGEKPKRLEIMFPVSDPSVVFPQALTWYGKSKGVKCKGDGEIAYRWHEQCDGSCENHACGEPWHLRKCPCEKYDADNNGKAPCGLRGHLMFLIPRVSVGGVYQLDTGSYHSTVDVNSGIDYVRMLIQEATGQDRFSLIPLILERVPRQTGGGESGARQTHYTLRLTCDITINQLAGFKRQLAGQQNTFVLPEPVDENPAHDDVPAIPETTEEQKEKKIFDAPEEPPLPEPPAEEPPDTTGDNKKILLEQIKSEIIKHFPGKSEECKTWKHDLFNYVFGTGKWKEIESMEEPELTAGLQEMRVLLEHYDSETIDSFSMLVDAYNNNSQE